MASSKSPTPPAQADNGLDFHGDIRKGTFLRRRAAYETQLVGARPSQDGAPSLPAPYTAGAGRRPAT
jgi:hypothetical protein